MWIQLELFNEDASVGGGYECVDTLNRLAEADLCNDCDKAPCVRDSGWCEECLDIRACSYEPDYSAVGAGESYAAAVEQAYGPKGLKRK